MKHFQITVIHGAGRSVLNVIAQSSWRAMQIATGMLPEPSSSFAVICKPGDRKTCAA